METFAFSWKKELNFKNYLETFRASRIKCCFLFAVLVARGSYIWRMHIIIIIIIIIIQNSVPSVPWLKETE
jgi:hypothetical protein